MSFINKRIQFRYRIRGNGRTPSGYPLDGAGIPLRITQYIPMKLKDVDLNKISSKSKESSTACIPEMMTLFDCYEKHDFNSQLCSQQNEALQKCFTKHQQMVAETRAKRQNKAKI